MHQKHIFIKFINIRLSNEIISVGTELMFIFKILDKRFCWFKCTLNCMHIFNKKNHNGKQISKDYLLNKEYSESCFKQKSIDLSRIYILKMFF